MKDRQPLKPNRVLITPEGGSDPYYATVTRADDPVEPGTTLSKTTFLKDTTAALYGLGTDAVPDDVLITLGGLYHHNWYRTPWSTKYVIAEEESGIVVRSQGHPITGGNTNSPVWEYADRITIRCDTGEPAIYFDSDISTMQIEPYNNTAAFDVVRGKFCRKQGTNTFYFFKEDATATTWAVDSTGSWSQITAYLNLVTLDAISYGATELVSSMDSNAYPKSNHSDDGYYYLYVGIPFNNAVNATSCKLLWKNASPGSNFGAQTLPLDTTGYQMILIVNRTRKIFLIPKEDGFSVSFEMTESYPEYYSNYNAHRDITVNDDSIVFGRGWYQLGTSEQPDKNDKLVPLFIYGIKGVKVV